MADEKLHSQFSHRLFATSCSEMGISYISSGVCVSGQTVTFGQSGISTEGEMVSQSKTEDIGTSARSYSYSIPSDWEEVADDGFFTTMGANYTITLKRGTSSWNCEINNLY